jgi:HAMP domain-containing protein
VSFRLRLLAGLLLLALLPLAAFALGVRRQVGERLAASFEARVEGVAGTIETELGAQGASISERLAALAAEIADDNRLRRAIVRGDPAERAWLLDYAGRAMRLSGLSVLQLHDEEGRILSSGHFRAEYDRLDPALPAALASAGPAGSGASLPALAPVRMPDGTRLALLRREPVTLGGRRLALVGGVVLDEAALARLGPGPEVAVALVHPEGRLGAPPGSPSTPGEFVVAREIPVRWAGATPRGEEAAGARFVVIHSLTPLREARAEVARWFLLAGAVTAAAALLLAAWLSARIGRPLAELARKTARVDLDRLDVEFATDRRDEVGALSRVMGAMAERLRASAARLREPSAAPRSARSPAR